METQLDICPQATTTAATATTMATTAATAIKQKRCKQEDPFSQKNPDTITIQIFSANEVCNRLGNFVAKMMTSLFRKKKVFWSEIFPFPKIISPEKFGSFRFGRNLFSTTQRKF